MAIARQCLLVTLFLTATLFTGAIRGAEPIDSDKTVTDKPITSSTTVQPPAPGPETTKTPLTTTTKVPETTTKTPEPTTKPSTTVSPPTTPPTTAAPTTAPTTVVPPTPTTPAPAPTPAPSKATVGNWTIVDGSNHTVAIFRAAITIDLAFTDKSNKTQHYNVFVPADAKVDKVVDNVDNSMFSLVFPAGSVHMTFMQNNSHYFLQKVDSFINVTVLPELAKQTNATNFTVSYVAQKSSTSLEASVNSSYVCASPAALPMNNGTSLQLASVTYQAFIKDGKLGPAQNCVTDNSPDMVPILVAGGLILFVVLILVAYIVTRQRQARGYHSM